jgi:hypothetical protein
LKPTQALSLALQSVGHESAFEILRNFPLATLKANPDTESKKGITTLDNGLQVSGPLVHRPTGLYKPYFSL